MRSRSAGPMAPRGFVLAVTLWLLAGIAVVVGLMTWWAVTEVRAATVDRDRVEDEAAALATRETLLYLAATREITLAGLSPRGIGEAERAVRRMDEFGAFRKDPLGDELRMDGRSYVARGGVRFALQDDAGLFPMVLPSAPALDRFLASEGVAQGRIPALRDAFLDYVDPDDLKHLEGMEARDYRRAGLDAPPNRFLLAPPEVLSVPGWGGLPEPVRAALVSRITPYYSGPVNLNTAPPALLAAWLPGCPAACRAVAEQRDRKAFVNSADLEARVGIQLPGDDAGDYRYAPGDTFSLTLWGRSGGGQRLHVRLTPLADKTGPWTVLAAYPVPRPSDDAPAFTPDSDLLADPTSGGRPGVAVAAGRPAGSDRMGGAPRKDPVPAR